MREAPITSTSGFALSLGWLLLIGGLVVLVGYGIYEFVISETDEPLVKWSVGAIYAGLVVLLLVVLRQRRVESKTDPYKDVEI